ncbi:MAG: hypothetical protein ACE5KI_04380 [Dehalococcoidia bacterium]
MPALSFREQEILDVLNKLGGEAHPTRIGQEMGISPDYAEQLADYMVWKKYLVRKGLKFQIVEE